MASPQCCTCKHSLARHRPRCLTCDCEPLCPGCRSEIADGTWYTPAKAKEV